VGVRRCFAFLAVLVTLWAVLRETKTLEVAIDERQLVGIKDDFGGKLQLLFEGIPKSDIWLVTISFFKRGVRPVLPEDFQMPLSIKVDKERSEILKCSVRKAHPEQLAIECSKTEPATVSIAPLLLNGGDRFTIELLVSDHAPSKVHLDYRIAGLPQIVRVNDFERKRFLPNWIGNLAAFGIAFWLLSKLEPGIADTPFRALVGGVLVVATAITVVEVYVVRPIFRRWGHRLRSVR
jgi:hypothetical protein